MKTKSLSIFLVALFVVEMNLGTEEDKKENKGGEDFKYKIMKGDITGLFDFSLKTVLIGDDNVGKSVLIEKICNNIFSEDHKGTVGFEFFTLDFKIVSDKDEPLLRFQIWDCCGMEVYRSLISSFLQSASVFLLVYDVTNVKSFEDIDVWLKTAKEKNDGEIEHFVLIGTKIDLNDDRKVTKEIAQKFAEEKGMKFVEVSAKTGEGIEKLENILEEIIFEEFKKYKEKNKKIIEDGIEYDSIMEEKHTHSSSLCEWCKEICGNC